jgi:hypothetical protein
MDTHRLFSLDYSEAVQINLRAGYIFGALEKHGVCTLTEESAKVIRPDRARGISFYHEFDRNYGECRNTRYALLSVIAMFRNTPQVLDSPRGIVEVKCSITRTTIVFCV